jgi:tetratricopeptide (TPR) repeat protein
MTVLPESWIKVTLAITALLSAGFGLSAWAQSASSPAAGGPMFPRPGGASIPQRLDVLEEIQSLVQDSPDASGFHAEYKTQADAATLAREDTVIRAMSGPPSTISAQRLRHHPPKAALKAFELGMAARGKGRQAEAIEHLAAAVSLDTSYVEARAELGVSYAWTGEVSKALDQFERASELEPNSSMLHFNQAWTLLSLGRASEAEREARLTLALNPRQIDTQRLLALALFAQVRPSTTER